MVSSKVKTTSVLVTFDFFRHANCCPQRNMPVSRLLSGPKMGKRKIWQRSPVKFYVYRCRILRLQPAKPSQFGILPISLPRTGESFSTFVCVYLAGFMFLIWWLSGDKQPNYKHLPWMGAFSHNSIAPGGETTYGIRKS